MKSNEHLISAIDYRIDQVISITQPEDEERHSILSYIRNMKDNSERTIAFLDYIIDSYSSQCLECSKISHQLEEMEDRLSSLQRSITKKTKLIHENDRIEQIAQLLQCNKDNIEDRIDYLLESNAFDGDEDYNACLKLSKSKRGYLRYSIQKYQDEIERLERMHIQSRAMLIKQQEAIWSSGQITSNVQSSPTALPSCRRRGSKIHDKFAEISKELDQLKLMVE